MDCAMVYRDQGFRGPFFGVGTKRIIEIGI